MSVSGRRENWIGLLSFGFFIMLFALFFVIVPDYYTEVMDFFQSFELQNVFNNVLLPAPQGQHRVVYETVMQFCIVFGLFQFAILGLRFYFQSPINKMAETSSNIVIWLGAAYMFSLLLAHALEAPEWFRFLGGVVAVFGLSLIIRSIIVLLFWKKR